MRKELKIQFAWLLGTLFLNAGCSTETVSDFTSSSTAIVESGTVNGLTVNISQSYPEKGEDGETKVESLHLAFYTTDDAGNFVLTGFMPASPTVDKGVFKAKLDGNSIKMPAYLLAIANYDETDVVLPLMDPIKTVMENGFGVKGIVMSNVRYFNSQGEERFLVPLNEESFEEGAVTDVSLERMVAKGSVTAENDYPPIKMEYNGKERLVYVYPENWTFNLFDKAGYLVRQIGEEGYEGLITELSGIKDVREWNEPEWNGVASNNDTGRMHWAHSYAWNNTLFAPEDPNCPVVFKTYREANNPLRVQGEEIFVYVNESTRPKRVFLNLCSLPVLTITGHISLDNNESHKETTLFRKDREIMTEDEFWEKVALNQDALYYAADNKRKVSGTDLRKILENVTPEIEVTGEDVRHGLICPQLKAGVDLKDYCDAIGNQIDGTERILQTNRRLYGSLGISVIYYQGMTAWSAPVRHFDIPEGSEDVTGSFGIVRNTHYRLHVKSISTAGEGILSPDDIIIGEEQESGTASYSLGMTVTVLPWNDVNDDVDL